MKFTNVLQNKDVYADGIHDDTKALQACIDELKDGGTVYFPNGTYLVSAALIFYSYQHLKLSDNAVILRSDKSEPLTRYLLASYSEPEWGAYEGTHDVVISGGIFDGNKNLDECITLVNTVHCSNITIENCRFRHCAHWHCIEINGTQNTTVQNCIFDGPSGRIGKSRGYIFFRPMVYNLTVRNNVFIAPEETDSPAYGIIHENDDLSALKTENNLFIGRIDKEIIKGMKE